MPKILGSTSELTLTQEATPFNNLETIERIPLDRLYKLINSNYLLKVKTRRLEHLYEYENEKEFLMKLKDNVQDGKLKVKYILSKHGYGRAIPVKSRSACCIRREVRHTLFSDIYADVDIKNCHPSIIEQLLTRNGYESLVLNIKTYNDDREAILDNLCKHFGVSRDTMKNYFILVLYGGNFKTWVDQYKRDVQEHNKNLFEDPPANKTKEELKLMMLNDLPEDVKPTQFMTDYHKEVQGIIKLIWDNNPKLYKKIEKFKLDKAKKTANVDTSENGIKRSMLSVYNQEWERRILYCVYRYLVNKNIIENNECVLCYDGIMILLDKFKPELLEELSTEVKNKMGFDLTFTKKEMTSGYDLTKVEKLKEYKIPLEYSKTLDVPYFSTLSNEDKKTYFEHFICKVMSPSPMFIYKHEKNNGIDVLTDYTEHNLEVAFRNCKKKIFNDKGVEQEIEYVKEWTGLLDMRKYDFIDFDPSPNPDPKIFNTFRGFHPITKTTYKPLDKVKNYLNVWNSIGRALCGGNDEHYLYFKTFLAQLVQEPHKRIPISFLFKGEEGTGKNMFLNCIGNLIGDKHYISSSNASDFFGEHSEGFVNKLLVNMNEVDLNKTKDIQGAMKSFISEDKIGVNPKNVRPFQINNYARLILFSNKPNPIPLEVQGKDRRWVIFKTSDEFLSNDYDSEFWERLVKIFNTNDFIKALYDELMAININKIDWKQDRPITDAYKEMFKLFFPTEVLWLEQYLINLKQYLEKEKDKPDFTKETRRKGAIMYEKYKEFCIDKGFNNNTNYQTNIKQFYNKIYELNIGINAVTGDDGGKELVFTPSLIQEKLNNKFLNFSENTKKTKKENSSSIGLKNFNLEDF